MFQKLKLILQSCKCITSWTLWVPIITHTLISFQENFGIRGVCLMIGYYRKKPDCVVLSEVDKLI